MLFETKFRELKANIDAQISETTAHFINVLKEKDKILNSLTDQVKALQEKNNILEAKITSSVDKMDGFEKKLDEQDMYERRDTLVFSGLALPPEISDEDPIMVVVNTVNKALGVNLEPRDISIAHRLGPQRGNTRPMICKFVHRSSKSFIVHKCITKKVNLYANEHLTPQRRRIFAKLLKVKKSSNMISQLHSKDGKLFMKLKNGSQKFSFTNEESLLRFLAEESPFLMNCYQSASSSGAAGTVQSS